MNLIPHSIFSNPHSNVDQVSQSMLRPVTLMPHSFLDNSPKKKVKLNEMQVGPSDSIHNIEYATSHPGQREISFSGITLSDLQQVNQKSILDHYQNRLINPRTYYEYYACNRFLNQTFQTERLSESQIPQSSLNYDQVNSPNIPPLQLNMEQTSLASTLTGLVSPNFLYSETIDKDPLWSYLDEQHKDFEEFVNKINSIISICAIKLGSPPRSNHNLSEPSTSPLRRRNSLSSRDLNSYNNGEQGIRTKRNRPQNKQSKKTNKPKKSLSKKV